MNLYKERYSALVIKVLLSMVLLSACKSSDNDPNLPLTCQSPKIVDENGHCQYPSFPSPIMSQEVFAEKNMSAHWVDAQTLLWQSAEGAAQVYLYSSVDASLSLNGAGELSGNFIMAPLAKGDISSATIERFPHLKEFSALQWPIDYPHRDFLIGQLYIVAVNENNQATAISHIQIPGVLDDLYTSNVMDADDVTLGAYINEDQAEFKLWSPTAHNVKLLLLDANKQTINEALDMALDSQTGVWSYKGDVEHGTYYRYQITVYHPQTNKIEYLDVTDPYSVSLSANSQYSQFIDWQHDSLSPEGWQFDAQPIVDDRVIYESHIRDFSVGSDVSLVNQGKFLAFTESESIPVKHLKALQEAGLTYFHLLPIFDIATVDEQASLNLNATVAELCELTPNATLCSIESSDLTLKQLLDQCDVNTQCAETLMTDIRDVDAFNWGYDPLHYGVPEGSYASNPEGTTRIIEFRQMILALHNMGLRVVMDVVYNHTHASGIDDQSILDKVVPGYYHRLDPITGEVETSTCCQNTATEHRMMAKLMIDTLTIWAKYYHIDAFRFDLMGVQPLPVMQEALTHVTQQVEQNIYFYGEGWNIGDGVERRFKPSYQTELAGSGIGSFSDRLRDAVRGGGPFDSGFGIRSRQGFSNGLYYYSNELSTNTAENRAELLQKSDQIRVELAGGLRHFTFTNRYDEIVRGDQVDYYGQPAGYVDEPYEMLSYVSKHDNQTLWDNHQYKIASQVDTMTRVSMQSFALSVPLLSQTVPFLHMGSELLRSKSFERDSFNSGDWFNAVDFSMMSNNYSVGLPREDKDSANYPLIQQILADDQSYANSENIQQMFDITRTWLKVRSDMPLLRLNNSQEILSRVTFHNTGSDQIPGLIVMSIDNGVNHELDVDSRYDAALLVFNATDTVQQVDLPDGKWLLHPELHQSISYSALHGAAIGESDAIIQPLSSAVFVMSREGARRLGWPVNKIQGDIEQ